MLVIHKVNTDVSVITESLFFYELRVELQKGTLGFEPRVLGDCSAGCSPRATGYSKELTKLFYAEFSGDTF